MNAQQRAPVVVHPPSGGGRRVEIRGQAVGQAFRQADVVEFVRRAGLEDADVEDPELVDWRGGDSGTWGAG